MNINRLINVVAAIWFIIVGGLMITRNGVFCIACGDTINLLAGIVTVVLGIAVAVLEFRGAAGPRVG